MNTDTKPVVKTAKDVLLINTCCNAGMNLVLKYAKAHPDIELNVKKIGILNARNQKLDKKYGFNIKSLNGTRHGILVVDEKIVDRC